MAILPPRRVNLDLTLTRGGGLICLSHLHCRRHYRGPLGRLAQRPSQPLSLLVTCLERRLLCTFGGAIIPAITPIYTRAMFPLTGALGSRCLGQAIQSELEMDGGFPFGLNHFWWRLAFGSFGRFTGPGWMAACANATSVPLNPTPINPEARSALGA